MKKLCLFFSFFFVTNSCFAAPPDNGVQGNLIFLGVNHTSTKSVWLSLTTAAGSFKLEGPGKQLIDEWTKDQRGLRLSLSPIVSQGNGGTHHLINAANNKNLDSQNQKGGIVFPPFPSWEPGTPTHPIVKPGTPTHPIVKPGTPTHPIVKPGTPTHPIVKPGTPTHPIVKPGTPTHPIVKPGTPTHPIVKPGAPTHPIVTQPDSLPEGGNQVPEVSNQTPVGVSQFSSSESNMEESYNQTAPVTPARQLDEEKTWNVWSDNYYLGIRDGRNNVNTKGGATNFTIGADRYVTNKLVAGVSFAAIHLDTTAFNNGLENNVRGNKVGPYFGYQISTTWAVDGSINYGQFQNRNIILSLNSQYVTKLVNTTLHAIGLYQFGNFQIRPQPLITYTYFRNPTYDFNGTILNIPVQITRKAEGFPLGFMEFKMETNYSKETKNGNLIQPYTEIGVTYAYVRPSNDQVYSGNLALASVPKTSGLFTLGLRSVIAKKLLIQASSSYFSLGQSSYDLWNARLLISYSF